MYPSQTPAIKVIPSGVCGRVRRKPLPMSVSQWAVSVGLDYAAAGRVLASGNGPMTVIRPDGSVGVRERDARAWARAQRWAETMTTTTTRASATARRPRRQRRRT